MMILKEKDLKGKYFHGDHINGSHNRKSKEATLFICKISTSKKINLINMKGVAFAI